MSEISQRRALLLATIVPAMLVAGCAAGGADTQAMKGAASPATPTDTMMSPEETDTPMDTATPTDTAGAEGARSAVQGFFDALKSGNVDQVMGTFADDAVVALDGAATATDTDAIRTLLQERLRAANGMAQATHTIEEARTLGEGAVVRATSQVNNQNLRGLFALTQDGGEWKIAELMTNKAP